MLIPAFLFSALLSAPPGGPALWYWEPPDDPPRPTANAMLMRRLDLIAGALAKGGDAWHAPFTEPVNLRAARIYLPREMHTFLGSLLNKADYPRAWDYLPYLGEVLSKEEDHQIREYIRGRVSAAAAGDFIFRSRVLGFGHPEIATLLVRRVGQGNDAVEVEMEGMIDEGGVPRRTPRMRLLVLTESPLPYEVESTYLMIVSSTSMRAKYTEGGDKPAVAKVLSLIEAEAFHFPEGFLAKPAEVLPELP